MLTDCGRYGNDWTACCDLCKISITVICTDGVGVFDIPDRVSARRVLKIDYKWTEENRETHFCSSHCQKEMEDLPKC